MASGLIPCVVVLGPDPAAGIVLGNTVTQHEPADAVFFRSGDGYGDIAQGRKFPLKQTDGINGSDGGGSFQPPQNG